MTSGYSKFSIKLNERGSVNIIYWDRETNIKSTLELNNGLKSDIIRKIKLVQPEIIING